MSDRVFGAVCVAAAAGMAWAAQEYVAPISYEPVGPRAFPMLLAALMAIGGLWLLIRPSPNAAGFGAAQLKVIGLSSAAIFAYAALFNTLGFVVATALMAVPVGLAFGGTLKNSVLVGIGLGIGLFLLFDRLLDVVLPTGVLQFLLGGH